MLVTREVDYALRLLQSLSDGESVTASALCSREQVPQQFAYKILKKLERAGLVSITRGAEGGCRLAADLNRTSMLDLMQAMDADSLVNACMASDYACARRARLGGRCVIHAQLEQLQQRIDDELRAHSLEEILFGNKK